MTVRFGLDDIGTVERSGRRPGGWMRWMRDGPKRIDSWGVFPRATNVRAYKPYEFGDRWTGPPWLPLVADGHRWLPSLPLAAVGCQWLPSLPLITIGHHWLPLVHLGQIMTSSDHLLPGIATVDQSANQQSYMAYKHISL